MAMTGCAAPEDTGHNTTPTSRRFTVACSLWAFCKTRRVILAVTQALLATSVASKLESVHKLAGKNADAGVHTLRPPGPPPPPVAVQQLFPQAAVRRSSRQGSATWGRMPAYIASSWASAACVGTDTAYQVVRVGTQARWPLGEGASTPNRARRSNNQSPRRFRWRNWPAPGFARRGSCQARDALLDQRARYNRRFPHRAHRSGTRTIPFGARRVR